MDVTGHHLVEQRFCEALKLGRMHHAWLLYGMKGIGKRTLAGKLAGYLMCESHSACGECHGCKMIAAGSHPDLFRAGLIEGKRDVNIEQVREVLSFLSLSGAESGRRVVILDDAERMNNQAANALLKGLEEPAPGSMLLIICSDLERLPATVRSRCMLQQCAPLSDADVRSVLNRQEDAVDGRYLDLAVALADGAPGSVECMQDKKVAAALLAWQELVDDLPNADIGKVEAWIGRHIKLVPHQLICRILTGPARSKLQEPASAAAFKQCNELEQALAGALRWPGDVIRHSLRAGPSLLAIVLQLRASMRTLHQG